MSGIGTGLSELLAAALGKFGIDAFTHIDRLPWLLLAAMVALLFAALHRPPAIAWAGAADLRRLGARRGEPLRCVAWLLRAVAMLCLAFLLSGPIARHRVPPEPGRGLDIVLVLDTSGSMRALDTSVALATQTRIDLAKQVVARFASRRVAAGDRVGLVVFGDSAFTLCPLTSDGALLRAALARVEVGMAGVATALGDALALSVKRATGPVAESRSVVVLLTDGRNNAGSVPLDVAMALATGAGVRVHSVGIGSGEEEVPMAPRPGAPDGALRFERHEPDLALLRQVANATGGRFFAAERSVDLRAVYAEIDALERTPRALPPRLRQTERAQPLLALAGGLLFVEISLLRVFRRRLP